MDAVGTRALSRAEDSLDVLSLLALLGLLALHGPRAPRVPVADPIPPLTDEQLRDALRLCVDTAGPLRYELGDAPFLLVVDAGAPARLLLELLDEHLQAGGARALVERGCAVALANGARAEDLGPYARLRAVPAEGGGIEAGRTRRGTSIEVAEALAEFPLLLAVAEVRPDARGGATGGPASIVPGLSTPATARALAPDEAQEAAKRALRATGARALGLQCVTVGGRVVALAAGSLDAAFAAVVPAARHAHASPGRA